MNDYQIEIGDRLISIRGANAEEVAKIVVNKFNESAGQLVANVRGRENPLELPKMFTDAATQNKVRASGSITLLEEPMSLPAMSF